MNLNLSLRTFRTVALVALAFTSTFLGAATNDVKWGAPEPLPKLLYTQNLNLMMATLFQGINNGRPQIEAAVRAQRPHGLRFPGGTLANNYLWRTDSFSEPKNDLTGWAGQQIELFRKLGARHDLPGFARLCVRENLAPIWVLNVYEETPESVVALVQHLDSLGLRVRAIELGNEPYWDKRSLADVKAYIGFCRPLAAALKKARPEVRLGACFAPIHNPANYRENWNAVLAREDWFDAIVYHEYYGGQGFQLEQGAELPADAMLRPEEMVREFTREFAGLMPGKPIWFTEWNVGGEGLKQWKNTGAEWLFIAATYVELIASRKQIEWACFHQIFEASFGTFFHDAKTGRIQTNASYELFRLLGGAFADGGKLRPLTFTDEALRGFATGRDGDWRLFVLNRSAAERTISLPPEVGERRFRHLLAARPEERLPLSTPLVKSTPLAGRVCQLPPYSIVLVAGEDAPDSPAARAQANLFPPRPHLTLWYPPYAAAQPQLDPSGLYLVKTSQFKEKEFAVITMDLVSLGLEQGGAYTLDLTARSQPDSGLAVKLPDASQRKDLFVPLGTNALPLRFDFAYDRALNDGQIKFVLTRDAIGRGAEFTFEDFRLSKWTPRGQVEK